MCPSAGPVCHVTRALARAAGSTATELPHRPHPTPRPARRTEELELHGGEARFMSVIATSHTLYRTHRKFLPKTVTIVVDVAAGGPHFERVATLFVDLGTMCNASSKGWVEATAQATPERRAPTDYKIEARPQPLPSCP